MTDTSVYEIGWRSDDRSLIIGFDPDFFGSLASEVVSFAESYLPEKTKVVAEMDGKFILPSKHDSWGFGGAIQPVDLVPGFSLPCHRVVVPRVFWDREYRDITSLFNITASLGALFEALRYPEQFGNVDNQGPPKIADLSGFRLGWGEFYSSMIFATLYRPSLIFIKQLLKEGMIRLDTVEQAMFEAHLVMHPDEENDEYLRHDFRADLEEAGLHLSIPGNACGLDPSSPSSQNVVKLSPHNTDRPTQQLELAVGIAALCDAVRRQSA